MIKVFLGGQYNGICLPKPADQQNTAAAWAAYLDFRSLPCGNNVVAKLLLQQKKQVYYTIIQYVVTPKIPSHKFNQISEYCKVTKTTERPTKHGQKRQVLMVTAAKCKNNSCIQHLFKILNNAHEANRISDKNRNLRIFFHFSCVTIKNWQSKTQLPRDVWLMPTL